MLGADRGLMKRPSILNDLCKVETENELKLSICFMPEHLKALVQTHSKGAK